MHQRQVYAAVTKADAAVFAQMVVQTRLWLDAQSLKLNSELSNTWKASELVSRANKQLMFRIQANNLQMGAGQVCVMSAVSEG